MTYCVALRLDAGLIFLSDTRTNAGIDNISRFRKMHRWETPGERALALMTSGNLGITQGVVTKLQEQIDADDANTESILNCRSLHRAAEIIGQTMRAVQERDRPLLNAYNENASALLIFGGLRKGGRPRLFLIYTAGNFIEAGEDTPYLQIGEHKYGKPILDRVVTAETSLEDGIRAVLVSMDSTIRSNLSVGMPLDLTVIDGQEPKFLAERRIDQTDPTYAAISASWSESLKNAFADLPPFEF